MYTLPIILVIQKSLTPKIYFSIALLILHIHKPQPLMTYGNCVCIWLPGRWYHKLGSWLFLFMQYYLCGVLINMGCYVLQCNGSCCNVWAFMKKCSALIACLLYVRYICITMNCACPFHTNEWECWLLLKWICCLQRLYHKSAISAKKVDHTAAYEGR